MHLISLDQKEAILLAGVHVSSPAPEHITAGGILSTVSQVQSSPPHLLQMVAMSLRPSDNLCQQVWMVLMTLMFIIMREIMDSWMGSFTFLVASFVCK